ncbi:glycosyltransferase family protein [bacterium]|nr:glycosyltransferase family protein [bacterium]
MLSVITCVKNLDTYVNFCLPPLFKLNESLKSKNLEPIQIIPIMDAMSIFHGYNEGIKKAKYDIKVFIHEDVDLLDISWYDQIVNAFTLDPKIGLVGLVGTRKHDDFGFWWFSGSQHVVGSVYSYNKKKLWTFNHINSPYTEVECVDGFFMATNKSIPFDENLKSKKFFLGLYDSDYAREMVKRGYKIVTVPHVAWHLGGDGEEGGDSDALFHSCADEFEVFNKKWGLNPKKLKVLC